MSLDNIKVMRTIPPFLKRKRGLLYHLLIHLQLETKVTITVKICSILEFDLHSLRVLWNKEVTRLLHMLGVEELTQVSVMIDIQLEVWTIWSFHEGLAKKQRR